jgi:hypothetical protein
MENQEQNGPMTQEAKSNVDDIKEFYKGDFKNILVTFFKNPIEGIYSLLEKPSEKSQKQSLILFASTFVLYLIGGYVGLGKLAGDVEFIVFIKLSLVPLIFMFVISILSFATKSLSGTPNFKNELLTGGLCAIPLSIPILLLFVIKIFGSTETIMKMLQNPIDAGVVVTLIYFYFILMLVNIFQQSLKSSGSKDAVAWYLSPAAVLFALYITFQIGKNILF